MDPSSVLALTLASLHVLKVTRRKIVVLAHTTAPAHASRARTARLRKAYAQTRTATVSHVHVLHLERLANAEVAFDDQTSTFIIPSGSGFSVTFCPGGRSTNILATEAQKLNQLAQEGHTKRDVEDEGTLGIEAPDVGSIPLARLSGLSQGDVEEFHRQIREGDHAVQEPAMNVDVRLDQLNVDGDSGNAAVVETINMWAQRHRWNGSGTLLEPDLKGAGDYYAARSKRQEPERLQMETLESTRRSSANGHTHFVRQERLRSGFCVFLGMLTGAIGAWALV